MSHLDLEHWIADRVDLTLEFKSLLFQIGFCAGIYGPPVAVFLNADLCSVDATKDIRKLVHLKDSFVCACCSFGRFGNPLKNRSHDSLEGLTSRTLLDTYQFCTMS